MKYSIKTNNFQKLTSFVLLTICIMCTGSNTTCMNSNISKKDDPMLIDTNNNHNKSTKEKLEKQLFIACTKDDLRKVKYLIEKQNISPSKSDKKGNQPIHIAARNGSINIFKYLIEKQNISLSTPGRFGYGEDPFHIAISYDSINIFTYLIEKQNISPSTSNRFGNQPIHIAAREGSINIFKYLIEEQNISLSTPGKFGHGEDPFHIAISYDSINIFTYLIEKQNISPSTSCIEGNQPIHIAARNGSINIFKYLIEEQNISPSTSNRFGNQPIHLAITSMSHFQIVKYLFEKEGVDILRAFNKEGLLPIHIAAEHIQYEQIDFITEKDKKFYSAPTKDGKKLPIDFLLNYEIDCHGSFADIFDNGIIFHRELLPFIEYCDNHKKIIEYVKNKNVFNEELFLVDGIIKTILNKLGKQYSFDQIKDYHGKTLVEGFIACPESLTLILEDNAFIYKEMNTILKNAKKPILGNNKLKIMRIKLLLLKSLQVCLCAKSFIKNFPRLFVKQNKEKALPDFKAFWNNAVNTYIVFRLVCGANIIKKSHINLCCGKETTRKKTKLYYEKKIGSIPMDCVAKILHFSGYHYTKSAYDKKIKTVKNKKI